MSKKLSVQEKARRSWVRALRSCKYGWGKEMLHPTDNKFCCLGVLCEVAIKQGVIQHYEHDAGTLPYEVQKWIGIESDTGEFNKPIVNGLLRSFSLAEINDESKRNPFLKIANLLERKPAGLFVKEQD